MDARQRTYLLDALATRTMIERNKPSTTAKQQRLQRQLEGIRKKIRTLERAENRKNWARTRRINSASARVADRIAAADSYAKGVALVKAFTARKF